MFIPGVASGIEAGRGGCQGHPEEHQFPGEVVLGIEEHWKPGSFLPQCRLVLVYTMNSSKEI